METLSTIYKVILEILGEEPAKSYTLDELTRIFTLRVNSPSKTEIQSKLLDALIFLDDEGFVVLNSDTDKSSISRKGLLKVNNII